MLSETHPEGATHYPKLTRGAPASERKGPNAVVGKSSTPVSVPKRAGAKLNVKFKPEQAALLSPGDIRQARDKAKVNVYRATLSGVSTDGRPADSRRRFWDTVRKSGTAIAAQTVNFDTLTAFPFNSTVLDMVSAAEAWSIRDTAYHAWVAVRRVLTDQSLQGQHIDILAAAALDHYLVELGVALMDTVAGPHFTFLLPLVGSRRAIVSHAQRLIGLYEARDINRERIVISIPASEEGIAAAQMLQTQFGIRTNLYLVSGFLHALLCIEAGASAITFSCNSLNSVNTSPTNRTKSARSRGVFERQWLAEIETTIAYLDLHECKTQSVVTDLCGVSVAGLLHRVNSVSLRDRDLRPFDGEQVIALPADSDPALRARQTQYPTTYLAQKNGFLRCLDDHTRSLAEKVQYHGLKDSRRARRHLMQVLQFEIRRQVAVQRVDAAGLATLYQEDLRAEQARQKAQEQKIGPAEGTKLKVNPRTTHLGYRLAQMFYSEQQEPIRQPSPPSDLDDSDTFEAAINEYLGTVAESESANLFDEIPREYLLGHPANTILRSRKKSSEIRKLSATASDPGRTADGSIADHGHGDEELLF